MRQSQSFSPRVDVEVGDELFWYIFDGEPMPENGSINLDDATPGLGLTVKVMRQERIADANDGSGVGLWRDGKRYGPAFAGAVPRGREWVAWTIAP